MKLMPALPESIFDIGYLIFAFVSGITLLKQANKRKVVILFGCMTLILGGGDAFHLIPRVLRYWTNLPMTAALGIGKLVTSVTMTVFYLLLEYVRRERYTLEGKTDLTSVMWGLAAVRTALCLFPQNGWTLENPSVLWGIYRNIPFVMMGILTVYLWFRSSKKDRSLRFLWLVIFLSFAFYLPVVLFAQKMPMIGMLMLPKTVMYIIMICMFQKTAKNQ